MKFHPERSTVRQIIEAYRDKHSVSPFGPAYGPDWQQRIKGYVAETIKTGKTPYFMTQESDTLIPAK